MPHANDFLRGCPCRACVRARNAADPMMKVRDMPAAIICPRCGNKRCPHANHHEIPCLGDAVQPGKVGAA
jgi:hypothetical protein